jgi:hypothetical protein
MIKVPCPGSGPAARAVDRRRILDWLDDHDFHQIALGGR